MEDININNDNIMLPFALDSWENIRLINEITEQNRYDGYVCPICKNKVIPCAIKESNKVSRYYKHENAKQCSSESMIHYWYKEKYLMKGDKFYIDIYDIKKEYICEETITEQIYKTSFGEYKPDVTVITNTGEKIFFEYKFTNKKEAEKYSDIWRELNCTVIEIDIKTLYDGKGTEKIFKPLFYDGVVLVKTKNIGDNILIKHIKENNINDRMRVKYLYGFLRDCYRYNVGDLSIEDLVIIIDSMNSADKLFIPKMLGKLKCNTILNDYSNYKLKLITEKVFDMYYEQIKSRRICNDIVSKIFYTKYTRKYSEYSSVRFNNTLIVDSPLFSTWKHEEEGYNLFGDSEIVNNILIMYKNDFIKNINKVKENYKYRVYNKNQKRISLITKGILSEMLPILEKELFINFTETDMIDNYSIEIKLVDEYHFTDEYCFCSIMDFIKDYTGIGRINIVKESIKNKICERIKDVSIKRINFHTKNKTIFFCSEILKCYDNYVITFSKTTYKEYYDDEYKILPYMIKWNEVTNNLTYYCFNKKYELKNVDEVRYKAFVLYVYKKFKILYGDDK